MSSRDVVLSVQELKVHFSVGAGLLGPRSAVKAVDGVSFEVRRGTTFGIVGESGSGKSTTALAIMRLAAVTAGSVRLGESDIGTLQGDALRKERHRFQMVFQDPFASLNPRIRAGDAILNALNLMNVGETRERSERAKFLFTEMGLKVEQMSLYPHQFSGGQ
jgi:peptide/nickel transport system ATP-binding protein